MNDYNYVIALDYHTLEVMGMNILLPYINNCEKGPKPDIIVLPGSYGDSFSTYIFMYDGKFLKADIMLACHHEYHIVNIL